jgi:hypothetical protein
MAQVLSGHRFGPGFTILYGSADPNSPTAPLDVQGASADYCYFRLASGNSSTWLYRCSVSAIFQNGVITTPATWVAVNLP